MRYGLPFSKYDFVQFDFLICQDSVLVTPPSICPQFAQCSNLLVVGCNPDTSYYLANNECVSCTYPNICSQLVITSYFYNMIICDNNCATCTSTLCLTCIQASYYPNGTQCTQCPSQCLTCDGSVCSTCVSPCQVCTMTNCQQCIGTNYYINPAQLCIQCGSQCSTCDSVNCLTCTQQNYYTTGSICSQCPVQCATCNATTCLTCASPCATCSWTQCTSCLDSHSYGSGITCLPCDSSCSTCNSSQCLSCPQANQYILGNLCLTCDSSCTACNSTTCLVCAQSSYYPSGTQCIQCPSQCSTCNGSTCSTCASSCSVCNMSACLACIGFYYYINLSQQCIYCGSQCQSCNDNGCQTCLQSNYYPNGNICSPCPIHCLTCNSNTCLTCKGNCAICNYTGCIGCVSNAFYPIGIDCIPCGTNCSTCDQQGDCQSCLQPHTLINQQCVFVCDSNCAICTQTECSSCVSTNYYPQGQTCVQCKLPCLTCNNKSICYSCNQNSTLQNGRCICNEGFNLNIAGVCIAIDCISLSSRSIKYCNYSDCIDGIWEYGEQCDNGNQISCINCKIDKRYACLNTILEPSYCTLIQPNCLYATIITPTQIQCNACVQGYYLIKNQLCNKCLEKCLACNSTPIICTYCRFPDISISLDCQLCDINPGFYSDFVNNVCYTICGDNITTGKETCDIDSQSSLGCTNCQIDYGYICYTDHCEAIIYPIPSLVENLTVAQLFDMQKKFILSYNSILNIQDISFNLYLTNSNIQFAYNITQSDNVFEIDLALYNESIQQTLVVKFTNSQNIYSYSGFSQSSISQVQIIISDYLIPSELTVRITQGSVTAMHDLLIFLLSFVCFSIVFGGLTTFWNLLDLLQVLSYLQFINTSYPYNLQTFISLFDFIQLPNLPINNYFNMQSLLKQYIDIENAANLPIIIADSGYTCITLYNIIPLIQTWIFATLIVMLARFCIFVMQHVQIELSEVDITWIVHCKLKIYLFKSWIIEQCKNINNQWYWSGIIRIIQSSAYDISFSIALGLYGFDITVPTSNIAVNSYLALCILITYVISCAIICKMASYNFITLKNMQMRLGSIYEGLKFENYAIYHNCFLLLKKLLFMIYLVLLYTEPVQQVFNMIILSTIQLTLIYSIKPFKNKFEYLKQLICEFFMIITQILIFALVLDDNLNLFSYYSRDFIGWLCIATIMLLMVAQVSIDIIQQFRLFKWLFNLVKERILKVIGYTRNSQCTNIPNRIKMTQYK